jgi:heterodisulfide reductase subunit B
MSTRYLVKAIGLKFRRIPDWNCCGASSAHLVNRDLSLALPARSLAISEETFPGLDVVAPCAACFGRLNHAQHYVRKSAENRAHIESLIDREYRADANVLSLLQVIVQNEDIKEALEAKLTKSLHGLKVACYYGCMLIRPVEEVNFDDAENPQSMDEVMRLVGADTVDWAFKTECCGASLQVTEPAAGKTMVEKILHNAYINGAEAIVTACPLCQLNLDMREREVNRLVGTNYDIPVFYFTELVSLCLGAKPTDVGIDKHYVAAVSRSARALEEPAAEPDVAPDDETEKVVTS